MNKIDVLIKKIVEFYCDEDNLFHSKEREIALFNELIKIDFIESGEFLKQSLKKSKFKNLCESGDNFSFSLKDFMSRYPNIDTNKVYLIHEPFGSHSSNDFLFISNIGFLCMEDKKGESDKIKWNTGWMGMSKLICFYNRKKHECFLYTSLDYHFDNNKTLSDLSDLLESYRQAEKEFSKSWEHKFKEFGKPYSISSRKDFKDNNKPSKIFDENMNNVKKLISQLLGV